MKYENWSVFWGVCIPIVLGLAVLSCPGEAQVDARSSAKPAESPPSVTSVADIEALPVETTSIRCVSTPTTTFGDAHARFLTRFENLRRLEIKSRGITLAGMKYISRLENLEFFELSSCRNLDESGYAELARLKNLRVLILYEGNLNESECKHIGRMNSLHELRLISFHLSFNSSHNSCFSTSSGDYPGNILSPLAKLLKLERLSFSNTPCSCSDLDHLAKLPNLIFIELTLPKDGIGLLAQFKELQSLYMSRQQMTDVEFLQISNLESLRELKLNGFRGLTDAGLYELAKLNHLERLDLKTFSKDLDDGDLAQIGKLKNLKWLELEKCGYITDAGMKHISSLKSLEHLSLGLLERISKAGLRHLSELRNMKELTLACRNFDIDLSFLKPLSMLIRLEKLDISRLPGNC